MTDGMTDRITRPLVLFDGACPMCRREIAHYRRVRGGDRIDWIDLAALPDGPVVDDIDRAAAMARMHVRDDRGTWHTGAAAFVEMWRHLRGYRWLAGAVTALRLTRPLDAVYRRFARWRLARQCGAVCDPSGLGSGTARRDGAACGLTVTGSAQAGDKRG